MQRFMDIMKGLEFLDTSGAHFDLIKIRARALVKSWRPTEDQSPTLFV